MTDTRNLLSQTRIEIAPESFHVISMNGDDWDRLLEDPRLSPRMSAPFLIFKDRWEVTLVLDDMGFQRIRAEVGPSRVQSDFRLMSFDVELDFDVVGFMAEIAGIFSKAGISILAVSSFSRDHILLRQKDLPTALNTLRGRVEEIC